jgi:hypothetical protein
MNFKSKRNTKVRLHTYEYANESDKTTVRRFWEYVLSKPEWNKIRNFYNVKKPLVK